MTETTTEAGSDQILWYKNHIEANYVIEGEGEVENVATGERYPAPPGHHVHPGRPRKAPLAGLHQDALRLCLHPALTGRESHDEDGSYNASKTEQSDRNQTPPA